MLEIDGSQGEGGGQVLRSSLALSILTGRPFKIWDIRARREKPGLLTQHLRAVDAAAAVSRAQVQGAALGSRALTFEPGAIRSGRYHFEIQTAGSTSLVLQTIFLPLSLAGSASSVIISGGTHVPHAPTYHYLERQWLPWMQALGFDARLTLEAAGFYPQGLGRIAATVRPAGEIAPLRLVGRGPLSRLHGLSAVANLDAGIAERQKRQALKRLERLPAKIRVERLPSPVKGTLLHLLAEFDPPLAAGHPPLAAGHPPLAAGHPPLAAGHLPFADEPLPAAGALGVATPNPRRQPAGARTRTSVARDGAALRPSACYDALGALGKPAERVADEAVDRLEAFLAGEGAIDQYLADQLLLPLAFAAGISEFSTAQVTLHLLTNAAVIEAFGAARVEIQGEPGGVGLVKVSPTPSGTAPRRVTPAAGPPPGG